jgi:uncharacterized protein
MSKARARALARIIEPRPIALDIPDATPRYWMNGDPFASHLMNVLSFMFPGGESFFIESVRAFRDQIKDPVLRAQMRGFYGQEGLHTRAHKALNRWHASHGVDGVALERQNTEYTNAQRDRRTPIQNLAVTVALEHFTAVLAEGWLQQPELWTAPAGPLRNLWVWHAIEELDHKSVAFDVYQEVSGDYAQRVYWMARTTLEFVLGTAYVHLRTLAADGQLRRPLYLLQSWAKFWGPKGHFSRLIPAYLQFYRRDFHPWEVDHAKLIARFEAVLASDSAAA